MYAAYDDRMKESDLYTLSDDEMVLAVLADPENFTVLYERYAQPVYRMCYRAVGDVDLAEDLAARSFLTVYERLHQYRPQEQGSFRAWLFMVVRNNVRDHWRRHRREFPLFIEVANIVDADPGPEELVLARMQMDELRGVLERLNEKQRTIVELRLAGLNTNEIALAMDLSISALKSAQVRAYANIRRRLASKGEPS
ncbi:MAG: sigma-70 family RNA polymerase sigma factor [Thermomicrobiales bacterium]|nr:sigma-70 family RNA polymerase sigma factor [Thermomicrobiales bacterium]MCO5217318.1 sigma-70 family RNA polymerase sigma factor [Thermomicrobiales bacterium]MCO5226254.1 sigma-70 family RNA polymerase sigma factor [Thermomicrobiales bacterium]MCO5228720.1 sigma-70 family RNA polymerase sigma factor [Thermomicrobiales bacterium]